MMIIEDALYGEFQLEPIFKELMATPELKRLKKVHMVGAPFIANDKWNQTRFDHSVGVMLLVRLLGASVEEQIAALLHDISHTAFSHTIDTALEYPEEDYHEIIKMNVINNSDIPHILEKHGFDADILNDDTQFYRLEKDLPALCADRIDYTLRDLYHYFNTPITSIKAFIDSLVIFNNTVCVNNLKSAEWFTKMYNFIVLEFFYEPQSVISNLVMSDIIRYALQNKLIHKDDFMLNDFELVELLYALNNDNISDKLNSISSGMAFKLLSDKSSSSYFWRPKTRIIDPDVCVEGKLDKASHLSKVVAQEIKKAENKSKQGLHIQLL